MKSGFAVEVVYFDNDVVMLNLRGTNGWFSAAADVYVGRDGIARLIDVMRGFPRSKSDARRVELGTFDPQCAGGGVEIRLRCVDSCGHVAVHLRFLEKEGMHAPTLETAEFPINVEPAAIDAFVAELGGMRLEVGAKAVPAGVT